MGFVKVPVWLQLFAALWTEAARLLRPWLRGWDVETWELAGSGAINHKTEGDPGRVRLYLEKAAGGRSTLSHALVGPARG